MTYLTYSKQLLQIAVTVYCLCRRLVLFALARQIIEIICKTLSSLQQGSYSHEDTGFQDFSRTFPGRNQISQGLKCTQ